MSWFGKDPNIVELLNGLEQSNMTVYALKSLDYIVPGEWENPTDFDALMRKVTGETDPAFLARVKDRVIALYEDKSEGYQSAVNIYSKLDSVDKMAATAALANKMGEKFAMLSFLEKLTPKADTAQTIDFAVKIVGEIVAFIKTNGIPGDGIADFMKALGTYAGTAKIRMAALICFDGVLPLGPDFIKKVTEALGGLSESSLMENDGFKTLAEYVPSGDKLGYAKKAFDSVKGWMAGFVSSNNINAETLTGNLSKHIDMVDGKLDYVAAFIDMGTNYFEHTGIQSVATEMIKRAVNEV